MSLLSKETKQRLIRKNAPTLWNAFQRLDTAERMATKEFKERYGLFWKLKTNKEKRKERQIEIATELVRKEYEDKFAISNNSEDKS